MTGASPYLVALLMGLTGGLHCAGMCGPIMLFMPFHHFSGFRKALALAAYHLSRITVYALMAMVLYSFKGAFRPEVQRYVSMVLGVVLLLAGIMSFIPNSLTVKLKLPWSDFVKQHIGKFIGQPTLSSIAVSGALNGLLPCGLVYMALSASLAVPDAGHAALFTYVFGIGTLPVLVAITVLGRRVSILRGNGFRRLTPIIVFSFGCLFLLRGMNLGIPYLSPKVAVAKGKVVHSCCHKK